MLFIALVTTAQKTFYDKSSLSLKNSFKGGDTIVLKNGSWEDVDLRFFCEGSSVQPLVVMAETPGKVIITGRSSLSLAGKYIEVSGLVFYKCFNESKPVVQFKISGKNIAEHSRVFNCVIDDCNPKDRLTENNWIALFGRNNQFDHNQILNKKNLGTTLIVELNDTINQQNHHIVAYNYFGPRARGGSNGAETIRIGTSTFSRTSSNTQIRNNYFDRCSGEVEYISIKSCDNIISGNTFFECEGGLVLRHGNRNIIEKNTFIGNKKNHTGGVRIINADHVIRDNYFIGLSGSRFRSALTILNGVPNSPINRYDQVKNVQILNNLFIDCSDLEFCAGRDFERTARPVNVTLKGNVVYGEQQLRLTINDKTDGINASENYINQRPNAQLSPFFQHAQISLQNRDGIQDVLVCGRKITINKGLSVSDVGTGWAYHHEKATDEKGRAVIVPEGHNTISAFAKQAKAGDTLILLKGKVYTLSESVVVNVPLSVISQKETTVQYSGEQSIHFFRIENGGALYLKGLNCNGLSPNGIASSFVSAGLIPMIDTYSFKAEECTFQQLTDGRKHAFISGRGSLADSIIFRNCRFFDITGDVVNIAAEKDDVGRYNAEYVIFDNCLFQKILQGAIHVYRGGNDESTTGPYVYINRCSFIQCGNTELCSAVRLYGVQFSIIKNSIFYNSGRSGRAIWIEDCGWTKHSVDHCLLYESGRIQSFYPGVTGNNIIFKNPIPDWNKGIFINPSIKQYGENGNAIGSSQIFFK